MLRKVKRDEHVISIGNITNSQCIRQCDFMSRVNMVKCHFNGLPVNKLYSLFETYCMPMYGSQLWDLGDITTNIFYTAWRKAVRFLLNIPYNTHCSLLPLLCSDNDIKCQMFNRFIPFFKSMSNSNNTLVSLCTTLIQHGSMSSVSNSLTHVSKYYSVSRYDLSNVHIKRSPKYININDAVSPSVIKDLVNIKCGNLYISDKFDVTCRNSLIYELCVC